MTHAKGRMVKIRDIPTGAHVIYCGAPGVFLGIIGKYAKVELRMTRKGRNSKKPLRYEIPSRLFDSQLEVVEE